MGLLSAFLSSVTLWWNGVSHLLQRQFVAAVQSGKVSKVDLAVAADGSMVLQSADGQQVPVSLAGPSQNLWAPVLLMGSALVAVGLAVKHFFAPASAPARSVAMFSATGTATPTRTWGPASGMFAASVDCA